MPFQIAIDGPVAAGKGTVAKLVAARLGFLYVDTGAMYRATALLAQREGVDLKNEHAVAALLDQHTIALRNPLKNERDERKITVLLDGEDVSWKIRVEEVSVGSSIVAQHPLVRHALVRQQQKIASQHNVVMEGRDITFRVLPNAQLKIYLHADQETRAKRRHQELLIKGQDISLETVLKDLRERDERDMNRETDPLHVVEGSWYLDTSPMTIEQVVDAIVQKVFEIDPELLKEITQEDRNPAKEK